MVPKFKVLKNTMTLGVILEDDIDFKDNLSLGGDLESSSSTKYISLTFFLFRNSSFI